MSGAASRQASLPHAGLYLYAFTQGVDVVLDGFRELVVAVETDALQHASVAYPLAKVHDAIAHVRFSCWYVTLCCISLPLTSVPILFAGKCVFVRT